MKASQVSHLRDELLAEGEKVMGAGLKDEVLRF